MDGLIQSLATSHNAIALQSISWWNAGAPCGLKTQVPWWLLTPAHHRRICGEQRWGACAGGAGPCGASVWACAGGGEVHIRGGCGQPALLHHPHQGPLRLLPCADQGRHPRWPPGCHKRTVRWCSRSRRWGLWGACPLLLASLHWRVWLTGQCIMWVSCPSNHGRHGSHSLGRPDALGQASMRFSSHQVCLKGWEGTQSSVCVAPSPSLALIETFLRGNRDESACACRWRRRITCRRWPGSRWRGAQSWEWPPLPRRCWASQRSWRRTPATMLRCAEKNITLMLPLARRSCWRSPPPQLGSCMLGLLHHMITSSVRDIPTGHRMRAWPAYVASLSFSRAELLMITSYSLMGVGGSIMRSWVGDPLITLPPDHPLLHWCRTQSLLWAMRSPRATGWAWMWRRGNLWILSWQASMTTCWWSGRCCRARLSWPPSCCL